LQKKFKMIDTQLAAALRSVMDSPTDHKLLGETFAQWEGAGKRLVRYPEGKVVIRTEDPIERIHILLDGKCQVLNHGSDGKVVMAGNVLPPQIFGLYELVAKLPQHTADVQTQTDCIFFSVSARVYAQQLTINTEVASYSVSFLATFIHRLLDRSDRMTLHTDRQNLVWYILESCKKQKFPVVLPVEKETMAAELNMNLRTLYRKLAKLRHEGLVDSRKGKIEIDSQQYRALQRQLYENI
jgi:CRP-like cAMP-binding protein